jgi:PAS domain S-box-containing protein
MDEPPEIHDDTEMAYAQALRYGQDLARVYKAERAKRQELELTNQKLNAIWTTAPNGLAVLDEQMRIIRANPRFEALVEQSGRCVGRHLTELFPSDKLAASLAAAARDNTSFASVEVALTKPANRILQVTGAPLAAGDQRGWVISLFDLTERKRLEGLKEEFIDIAAHELRTPLAIILGFASVLNEDLSDTQDPLTQAPIEAIVGAASRLKMVINELVEFAAARSRSSGPTSVDQFDLWELIEHAVSALSYQASQMSVEVIVQSAGKPLMMTGDRLILAQAMGHLLENAIKFNRRGGKVYVRAAQVNGEIIVEIQDTGTGIPSTEMEKIFDMFYQVEEHMTRAQSGLGMGLPIARRAIQLHGGQIHVSSTVGQGTTFRITLPPVAPQVSILPQAHLETAHHQTLAYGKDLARAFTAQRLMAQKLRRVSDLCRQLYRSLESKHLEEAHQLVRQIAQEATLKPEPREENRT